MKTLLQQIEPSMVDLHAKIEVMLPRLEAREIKAIEYGQVGEPLGMYSAFRIERISTWAGPQFAIKPILPQGFGSGDYFPLDDKSRVIAKALQYVIRYHRPVETQNPKLRAFLERMRSKSVIALDIFEVHK